MVLHRRDRRLTSRQRLLAALRPDLKEQALSKPLTMLLFGMINWMFTWLEPDGELDYEAMAPIVADLFFGGVHNVQAAGSKTPGSRAALLGAPDAPSFSHDGDTR